MRVGIVSPPTVTEFGRDLAESEAILRLAEHAPVGVLTLAAVLQERGREADVIDTNRLYYDFLRSSPETDFCDYTVAHLLEREYDVIGFGSICSSYPLTLRMTARLAAERPGVRTILGGPQASVVDEATLRAFPSVDHVVRFEAEESFPRLLDAIEADADPASVPGITYRRGDDVVRTANAPVIADLDAIPLPAYDRYPYLREARYIPLELGRGCPYGCTFCSTNDFFRRRFRLKTPRLVVEQMSRLKAEYGIAIFDLIHDMFTVDRSKVVEFCESIQESGEEFYWNCSARTDRVDDELLAMMAAAGCRGIFFGIETGSATLQKTIKKRLVLPDAMDRIRAASENRLSTAVSLITGFPEETDQDFADTVGFFTEALRYEHAQPQLHILAPLADTPIHREYRDRLVFDDVVSDMSHQGWDQGLADRDLIARHPDIFANFYGVPTPLDREFVKEVRAFLLHGAVTLRPLYVGLHQEEAHLLDVFRSFVAWRTANGLAPEGDPVRYYNDEIFVEHFTRFVTETIVPGAAAGPALAALTAYCGAFHDVRGDEAEVRPPRGGTITRVAFAPESVPVLAGDVRFLEVGVDFAALLERLEQNERVAGLATAHSRLASRRLDGHMPEVLQLSRLSRAVLELCDGQRSVAEIAQRLERADLGPPGVPADKLCLIGLELLRHDGLVTAA